MKSVLPAQSDALAGRAMLHGAHFGGFGDDPMGGSVPGPLSRAYRLAQRGGPMKLLLVEDDETLGDATASALRAGSLEVDWVQRAQDARTAVRLRTYDAVLLDLGLPDMPGDEFLRQLRASKDQTPVIVLTARRQIEDRVNVLDLGADDYLVKPVDVNEVCARVRAVRRRLATSAVLVDHYVVGPLMLYRASRSASWCGQPVSLTTKEYDLLEALVVRRPHVVSRHQLEEILYGWTDEIDSNAVEVHVHYLRKKFAKSLVVTVRGQGYQIGSDDLMTAEADVQRRLEAKRRAGE